MLFEELFSFMNAKYVEFKEKGNDMNVLRSAIEKITLDDVITMLHHNINNSDALHAAFEKSAITNVATKVPLMVDSILKWKVKLHLFQCKNGKSHRDLVHFHPYEISSRILCGNFICHTFEPHDPTSNIIGPEDLVINEYLIPGIKPTGTPVKKTGVKLLKKVSRHLCKEGSVQTYPMSDAHSLEICEQVITIAFISETLHDETCIYDPNEITNTRRLSFTDASHVKQHLKKMLLKLLLIRLKINLRRAFGKKSREETLI